MNLSRISVLIVLVIELFHFGVDGEKACSSCYIFENGASSSFGWIQARDSCKYNKKHLVVLETEREWEFINKEIQSRQTFQNINEWYIGLYRNLTTGNWTWINGKPLTIDKWQNGKATDKDFYTLIAKEYPPGHKGSFNSIQGHILNRGSICEEETDNCQGVCLFHNLVPTNSTPPRTTITPSTTEMKTSTAYDHTNVSGLPGQPSPPTTAFVSSHEIGISWTAPAVTGDRITGYTVQGQVVRKSIQTQMVVRGASKSARLPVTPYTWYDIQVRAFNSKGDGPWSVPLRVRSRESVPSAAPGNFKLGSSSALSLDISWDAIPADQQQGKLLGYYINYKVDGSAAERNKSVGPSQLAYKLTGLEYKTYAVRMAGYTAVGVGKYTGLEKKLPNEGGPSHPQNVEVRAMSTVSIRVKWETPAQPNGNIIKYIISYGTKKDFQDIEKEVTGQTMEHVLDGLNKFTTYFIKVRGLTSNKAGNASEILNATTFEDGPGPPTQFNGQVLSDMDIHLSWKDPVDSNGIIRFYYIRIYDTKTGQQVKNLVNKTAVKQDRPQGQLISRLKPFTNYTFTIQAVTIKPGEMANFTARTNEGVPSQPRYVTAKLVNDDIVVTWSEPEDRNGILSSYKVFCEGRRTYNISFQVNNQVVVAKSSRRTVIKKKLLKPGTQYSVYVRATTIKGDGARSVPVILHTPSKAPPPPLRPRVVEDDVTPTTITISLTPSSDSNGKIIFHQVIVETLGKVSKRETVSLPDDIFGYKDAQANGDRFYIAAEFDKNKLPDEFVLGNGNMYGDYENAPLKPETKYKAYIRGVTEHNGKWLVGEAAAISLPPTADSTTTTSVPGGCGQKGDDDNSTTIVIITTSLAAVFFVVVVILSIVLLLILRRTKRRKKVDNRARYINKKTSSPGQQSTDRVQLESGAEHAVHVPISRAEAGLATYEALNDRRHECAYATLDKTNRASRLDGGGKDGAEKQTQSDYEYCVPFVQSDDGYCVP